VSAEIIMIKIEYNIINSSEDSINHCKMFFFFFNKLIGRFIKEDGILLRNLVPVISKYLPDVVFTYEVYSQPLSVLAIYSL